MQRNFARCTGRLTCSSHRKDPLFYLFASPAKPMLMSIRIVEFQPRKGASFVAEHLSLVIVTSDRDNRQDSFGMSAKRRPFLHQRKHRRFFKALRNEICIIPYKRNILIISKFGVQT